MLNVPRGGHPWPTAARVRGYRRTGKTKPALARAGSGVGVSVLLRQAEGFEGFGVRSKSGSIMKLLPLPA